jgi:hypothetical protein
MELTNTGFIIDRELARNRAENEAKRADMKQHADKLIQGFEKLDESHARRAIWELFQNAIDLSENSEIIIQLTEESIIFKHNGKPFTTNTLSCLVKQVSSKSAQSNEDEVGQYGTGFITTHSFGKKIKISGSIMEDEYFISLNDFEIDRIAQNSDPELIDKLLIQQTKVFDLVESGELNTYCNPYTSFVYETISNEEKENAQNAINSLPIILPYVIRVNEKLQSVKVLDKMGNETFYQKKEVKIEKDLHVTFIQVNNDLKEIYSIYSEDEDLVIVLPLSSNDNAILLDENLSKLFLYFPLIGSENFGFNYLVHSKQFAPTEPRDGIHLKSKNEQVQEKEVHNTLLIKKATELICDYVKKHCTNISNPYNLAHINFNTKIQNSHLAEYFRNLKIEWVNSFKEFNLVDSRLGRIMPQNTFFFSKELLLDEQYFDSIYAIVSLFWTNIPNKEIVFTWSNLILQWEDETTLFIDASDVAEKIEEVKNLSFFPDSSELIDFYKYLIENGFTDLFSDYVILPNIKNKFKLKSQLVSILNIDDNLIEIADIIMPDVSKRYIKTEFEFSLVFESYDRKQFSKDLNSQISEYNKGLKQDALLPPLILYSLIDYCKIFPSLENTGTRGKLMKLICKYYEVDDTFLSIINITNQEIDWLTPIKCLLRNFILELNTTESFWVEKNKLFLNEFISVVYDYYEFDDIIQTLPIFPNQLFVLCRKSELKLDSGIPDELKDLYDNIVCPTKLIRSTLILDGFEKYLKDGETSYSNGIGSLIEKVFQDEMQYTAINEHPYRKDILLIIKKISDDKKWANYFPTIEEKKAIIMMARISDEDTKNDLFSIIGLDKTKIGLLGQLAKQDDLERIINLGIEAIEEEKKYNADFQFKHAIGKHIEKLVREKIDRELSDFKVEVRDQQGGQDIIVEYNNSIVYFIEVKSRWDIRNSITMSPLQMKNAVTNKANYSLCCVDMANYKIGNTERYNVSDIQIIFDRINIVNDIGFKIQPLLDGILAVKDLENEVSLVGDYRGTIPQSIVKKGDTIDDFISNLIAKLF